MSGKLIIIVFILLLFPNIAIAEIQKLNVSIEIKPIVYYDAFVVGDGFNYKINLTNPMSETIYADFFVSIYNPNNVLIESTRNHSGKTIEPGKSIELIGNGGINNELAAFPFEIAGDYKIVLESSKFFDYYRNMKIYREGYNYTTYVRTRVKFMYYFDVMPKWQYTLWKEEKEINMHSLDLSQKMYEITTNIDNVTKEMNQATQEMNEVTKEMNKATDTMLDVAILTFGIAFLTFIVAMLNLKKR